MAHSKGCILQNLWPIPDNSLLFYYYKTKEEYAHEMNGILILRKHDIQGMGYGGCMHICNQK